MVTNVMIECIHNFGTRVHTHTVGLLGLVSSSMVAGRPAALLASNALVSASMVSLVLLIIGTGWMLTLLRIRWVGKVMSGSIYLMNG